MELAISSASTSVFLDPANANDAEDTALDHTTTGLSIPASSTQVTLVVTLTVPSRSKSAEHIRDLVVTITARESLLFDTGIFESNIPYQSVHTIKEAAGVRVEGGNVYKWELPVFIPSDAPPHEQSRHGRVHWTATAQMTFPGRFFNKTLEAVTTIRVVQIPSEQSAFTFEHQHDAFAEGLGPVKAAFISRTFSVGGYLRGGLLLAAPPPRLKLHSIVLTLIQTTQLTSRKRADYAETQRPERHNFMTLKGAELDNAVTHIGAYCRARPSVQGELELVWLARLPNEDDVRPSTLEGGRTAMSFTHQLEMSITFDADPTQPRLDQDGERLLSRYRTARPVSIYSCAAGWASVILPEVSTMSLCLLLCAAAHEANVAPFASHAQYSAIECVGQEETMARSERTKYPHCVCGSPLSAILRDEDEAEAGTVCTSILLRQRLSGSEPPQQQAEPPKG
ncbi:hypothetical protein BCV69DRAFT_132733 [Microstroma glucosiphilum]|uniref:Arrestin-like N-terminal domain-containing protein n=1 Tax=Pseudomicrostroma glucosiphilum TaxID=1684307 RepID=A0A316UB73_9BASI|nr:hypothetical protein BCV69DRAFT_132733 [Pseudomicrostroma glucosiphilum]PWN22104.1 hypothetical protein BCV69DRAFT_132733 [Pseudomicrostroma glucosiphilum]